MGNPIDHIEITNFKSIRHLKIEGCKRINVFIGYPNVGKSAILEAISALGYLQREYSEPYSKLCRLKSLSELFFNGDLKNDIGVLVNDEINCSIKYQNENSLNCILQATESVSNAHPLNKWYNFRELVFGNNSLSGGSIYGSRDFVKVKKYTFQNEFNNIKTNGLTLSFPEGRNLVDIVQFNKELRKEVSELFKASGLKLNIDQSNNSLKGFKQLDEELVFTIPFYQMADTLQRLVFHKAAIKSNENTVLLFEEPEAHMFPPYIKLLLSDIIFDKERNNQFFINTHSPFVLGDLIEDALEDLSVYLVGLKDGSTTVKQLSKDELIEVSEYGVDLFFNIESYLD